MTLSACRIDASVPVSDLTVAREFYEKRLGLIATAGQSDESRIYVCGDGTALHVYVSPDSAGRTAGTRATWRTQDIESLVDALSARGVVFERYDDPRLGTDAKGIHAVAGGKVAWFRDPDGNTFAIEQ